jgi:hypothetical protein
MALDYVKNLKELDARGDEVARPRAKMSEDDLAKIEAAARATERENGRFGRFRDGQGNWATAWQAPGPRTPLVAPRFVSPAVIGRTPTNELMLQQAGQAEPYLIEPQQWVVKYDGDDEVIVADDDAFRAAMTREDKIARQQQFEQEEQPVEALGRPVPEAAIPVAPAAPMPQAYGTTISIDNFVLQVLTDNERLRRELDQVRAWSRGADEAAAKAAEAGNAWQTEAAKSMARFRSLYLAITRAMGYDQEQVEDGMGPVDRDVIAYLDRLAAERKQAASASEPVEPPLEPGQRELQPPTPEEEAEIAAAKAKVVETRKPLSPRSPATNHKKG